MSSRYSFVVADVRWVLFEYMVFAGIVVNKNCNESSRRADQAACAGGTG